MRCFRPAAVTAVLASLLLTAACGDATSSAPIPGAAQAPAATDQTPSDRSGSPAAGGLTSSAEPVEELRFAAVTVDDQPFDGASLTGRDAVLWFWAPWCTVCRAEAPHVASVAAAAGEEVTFVGVAGLGEIGAMQEFVADYDLGGFSHLADLDGTIWQRFGVVEQPAYAFVDASGAVSVLRGALGADRLAAAVTQLSST